MGDVNQAIFVERFAETFGGPYLEVGARDYGTTQDLRPLFAGRGEYLGADSLAGAGVDVVIDLTDRLEQIDSLLGGARFGTIFCLSVLEHCENPFRMAENLTCLLKPGGKICISVPFAWKFHGYPSDYWRFTHEGIKVLFPRLHFDAQQTVTATPVKGALEPVDAELGKISLGTTAYRRSKDPLGALSMLLLRLLGRVGILRRLARQRYVLAPTQILMIGELLDT